MELSNVIVVSCLLAKFALHTSGIYKMCTTEMFAINMSSAPSQTCDTMTSLKNWTDCWTSQADVSLTQTISYSPRTDWSQPLNASSSYSVSLETVVEVCKSDISVLLTWRNTWTSWVTSVLNVSKLLEASLQSGYSVSVNTETRSNSSLGQTSLQHTNGNKSAI